MQCRLDSRVLNSELDFLAPVLKERPVQPTVVRFAVSSQGTLSLAAFDGHVDMRTEVAVQDAVEGTAGTRAGMVRSMAKLLPKGDVSLDGCKTHVTFNWGDGWSKFPVSAPWLLKPLSGTPTIDLTLPASELAEMIANAQFAIDDYSFGGRIPGVLLEVEADKFRIVATDGYGLAVSTRAVTQPQAASILLPLRAMASIRAMLGGQTARLVVAGDNMQVTCGGRQLLTRAVVGKFPSYQVMIPSATGAGATFHRADFAAAVQRVVLSGGDDIFYQVSLSLTTDSVSIQSGDCRESLSCAYGDAPYAVRFDAKKLRGLLEATKVERITLSTGDAKKPQLFQPAGRTDVQLVLMPINR